MKRCDFCGKLILGYDNFCKKCYNLINYNIITQCDKCGRWNYINTQCICNKFNINNKICIICGNDSHEYNFCKECYKLYKDKSILLKINNCKNIELLNTSNNHDNNKTFNAIDGHIVRSKSELIIDNFLFNNNIIHAYEKIIQIKENCINFEI